MVVLVRVGQETQPVREDLPEVLKTSSGFLEAVVGEEIDTAVQEFALQFRCEMTEFVDFLITPIFFERHRDVQENCRFTIFVFGENGIDTPDTRR